MALTRPLLRGSTTLEAALDEEENMLLNLAYPEKRMDFFVWLTIHRKDTEDNRVLSFGLDYVGDMPARRSERMDTRKFQRLHTSPCR